MKGIIVGGGTFLGYWLKNKIVAEKLDAPIIIDLPRNNTKIYVSSKDTFYPMQKINYLALREYRPNYVIFNFYDLFDVNSIDINRDDNVIMSVMNKILEIVQMQDCQIFILTHANRYYTSDDKYQSMFNKLNDLYLQYVEVISRVKDINTRVILLPNVFGPRESQHAIIRAIFTKIINNEDLVLSKTKRDFLYINSVIERCVKDLFESHGKSKLLYYDYSSGEKTTLTDMYNLISKVLGKYTNVRLLDETYLLAKTNIDSSKVRKVIIEQDYDSLIKEYRRFYKN